MTACFRTLESTLFNVSNSDIPCSGSNPTGCCVYGDLCMSNGICHYTKPTTVGSGYYLQSSTDSTFQSSIGQETLHCTTLDYPDVVYNATTELWACCSSDLTTGVHCSIATNETWAAPAPEALATIASLQQAPSQSTSTSSEASQALPASSSTTSQIPLTSSATPAASSPSLPSSSPAPVFASTPSTSHTGSLSTSASSSTTSTTSTLQNTAAAATATSNSSPSSSTHKSSLSAGADAGIGIGVALGLLGLISLIFFALRSTRQRRRQSSAVLFGGPDPTSDHHALGHKPEMSAGTNFGGGYQPPRPQRFTGEPQFSFPQEMADGRQSRYEAAGRQRHEIGS